MEHSDSIKNIATALCKVQANLRPLKRNADNPFFRSNYTDLAAMTETLYPLLTAEGLSVSQGCDGSSLETLIMHISGEWILFSAPLPQIADPQKFTAAITYFRRSGLAAGIGATSEGEDDDGNAASHPPARSASAPHPAPRPASTTPAAPVTASGGSPALHVKTLDVNEGTGRNGKPYKRFTVTFSDGTRCSTFSETDATILKNAKTGNLPVIAQFERQGNFTNLVSVNIAGEPPSEPATDDDGVPF